MFLKLWKRLRSFFRKKNIALNKVFVHRQALLHNFSYLQSLQPDAHIFPVLKANAYGHGIKQVCSILENGGFNIPYLVVDSFPEYQMVRDYSKFSVLFLGETHGLNYKMFDLSRTTFCVSTLKTLQSLVQLKKKVTIHLFLDVGMHREGFDEKTLYQALELLQHYKKYIHIEGVCGHLSHQSVDNDRLQPTIDLFKKMYYILLDSGFTPYYRHLGASAGTFLIDDPFFNAYRPGISLYGYSPFGALNVFADHVSHLIPALEFVSTVVGIHDIVAGQGVGYERSFVTDKPTKIATIPVGYFEGMKRKLSNDWIVQWRDQTFPVVGSISMNYLMIDVGDHPVEQGDNVVVISSQLSNENTFYQYANKIGTIVYEPLVQLHPSIRREIV